MGAEARLSNRKRLFPSASSSSALGFDDSPHGVLTISDRDRSFWPYHFVRAKEAYVNLDGARTVQHQRETIFRITNVPENHAITREMERLREISLAENEGRAKQITFYFDVIAMPRGEKPWNPECRPTSIHRIVCNTTHPNKKSKVGSTPTVGDSRPTLVAPREAPISQISAQQTLGQPPPFVFPGQIVIVTQSAAEILSPFLSRTPQGSLSFRAGTDADPTPSKERIQTDLVAGSPSSESASLLASCHRASDSAIHQDCLSTNRVPPSSETHEQQSNGWASQDSLQERSPVPGPALMDAWITAEAALFQQRGILFDDIEPRDLKGTLDTLERQGVLDAITKTAARKCFKMLHEMNPNDRADILLCYRQQPGLYSV